MKKTCPICLGTGRVVDQKKLGRLLRQCRLESGVSQVAVARGMGVSAPYLAVLEQGKRDWNLCLTNRALSAIVRNSTDKNSSCTPAQLMREVQL